MNDFFYIPRTRFRHPRYARLNSRLLSPLLAPAHPAIPDTCQHRGCAFFSVPRSTRCSPHLKPHKRSCVHCRQPLYHTRLTMDGIPKSAPQQQQLRVRVHVYSARIGLRANVSKQTDCIATPENRHHQPCEFPAWLKAVLS